MGTPPITLSGSVTGASLPDGIKTMTVREELDQPTDWSIETALTVDVAPFGAGSLVDKLNGDAFNENFVVTRLWDLALAQDGNFENYSFLQLDYQLNGDDKSDLVTIEGSDKMEMLLQPDQFMSDAEKTLNSTIINEIVAAFGDGMTVDFSGLPSMTCRYLHRVGSPFKMLQDVIWPFCNMRIVDNELKLIWPDFDAVGATKTLTDRQHLKVLNLRKSARNIRNRGTFQRIEGGPAVGAQTSNLALDTEKSGPDSLGIQTIPLDFPITSGWPIVRVVRGDADLFQWLDENENPIGTFTKGFLGSPVPAHFIRFTVTPGPLAGSQGPYTPAYTIRVTSNPHDPDYLPADPNDFDPNYSKTYTDTQSLKYGLRPFPAPFESMAIAMPEDALLAAERLVKWSVWQGMFCEVETFADLTIKPGDMIAITDKKTGMLNTKWIVHARTLNLNWEASTWLMNLELSRPLP